MQIIETTPHHEILPYGIVHVGTELETNHRIACDVDGVLANFYQGMLELAVELGLTHWPKYWTEIEGWWKWGEVSVEELKEVFDYVSDQPNWWLQLAPMEDSHHIHFNPIAYVTARRVPSHVTAEWLNNWGFPLAQVITVGVDESKIDALQNIKATHMVEDKAEAAIEINQAGILCYLLNRPWNINVVVPDYVPRIASLKDIIL